MIAGLYDIFAHWHAKGSCWIVSDTHFDDVELYQNKKRPNTEDYIRLINSKVGKHDTLIHLGDCGNLDAIRKIRGYKILIMGNHDQGRTNFLRRIETEKFDVDKYSREEVISIMKEKYPNWNIHVSEKRHNLAQAPFEYYLGSADNCLFDEVYSGFLIIGEKLVLSHEPIEIYGMFNLHGHIHSLSHKNDKNHFNCCADCAGFEPINFNQWMKSGYLSKIETKHRETIKLATKRKKERKNVR